MKKSKHTITGWLAENADPSQQRKTEKMFALSSKIIELMEEKGLNRVQLAEKMGKKPSEISKILSGSHNLTINTIFSLEEALEENIFSFSETKKEIREVTKYVYFNTHHYENHSESKYEKTKMPVIPALMQNKVI